MYKVMLVDDDYPTIEFLSETIDWEALGMELLSTHENGLQAYESAKEEMPDILVTDIGMPKMDGIELTKKLKQMKDNLQVAIISCHNEFSYAQQALKLDVQDYILKESLNPDDLVDILLQCKQQLDRDITKLVEVKQLQHKVKMNSDIENQKLLRQLIQGSSKRFLEVLHKQTAYIPVQFSIMNFYKVKENYISEDTLQFAILNVLQEMTEQQQSQEMVCVHYEGNKGFVFYPYQVTIKHDSYGELRNLLKSLQEALKQFLEIDLTFLIGREAGAETLRPEILSLLRNETQLFYATSSAILTIDEQMERKAFNQEMFSYYQEVTSQLKQALFERSLTDFSRYLEKWIQFCMEKQFHPKVVKEWFLRMVLDVNMRLRTMPYLPSNYHVETLQEEVFVLHSIYELQEWLQDYAKKCLDETAQQLKNNYHKDVLEACYYVSHHLHKKLSLDEVAEHLYLNSSYFSRLFKKEMQVTFVEYVKQRKVERAKELLEVTDDSVGNICDQLGYDNQSYFIKVFKKLVGCTPLEFRGNKWNGVNAK
ncbi:response regulator transcription factor [Gracilibacillus salinarum]|uniref:Response regulator n=1 Tax=Gracilibacillus salinarum TaxID=2932255 RepID=A0ABY4GLK3_9BACI|nr:AraC family transcriptional regulator [Gracilibacillus salinarum]UOQ85056.1 response regulator [Gracilibacillus salinarum]